MKVRAMWATTVGYQTEIEVDDPEDEEQVNAALDAAEAGGLTGERIIRVYGPMLVVDQRNVVLPDVQAKRQEDEW